MSIPVIAYDPGFCNTKVCVDGQVAAIQTAAARPRSIGLAAIGLKTAGRNVRHVEFANHSFAVGSGAWHLGHPLTSLDYYSFTSPERLALFYSVLSEVLPPKSPSATLVVGLPVPLLQDQAQTAIVFEALKQLKRHHEFAINGTVRAFSINAVKVDQTTVSIKSLRSNPVIAFRFQFCLDSMTALHQSCRWAKCAIAYTLREWHSKEQGTWC